MMKMMESTTTIDLTDTDAPTQETSIDEIHIETTEERLIYLQLLFTTIFYEQCTYFACFSNIPNNHFRLTMKQLSRIHRAYEIMCMQFSFLRTIRLHFILGQVYGLLCKHSFVGIEWIFNFKWLSTQKTKKILQNTKK